MQVGSGSPPVAARNHFAILQNLFPATLFSRSALWIATIGAILCLQVLLAFGHRPWLDEWQALQIALFSPDQTALFENLRYEGHPPLWYWWLQLCSLLAAPLHVSALAVLPLALATHLTLLLRLPFPQWQRVAISLSSFVLFDYFTVSRSLSLGVMLFVVAMLWRDRRWSWIAIALLPLADFLFGALSLVAIFLHWKEGRLSRLGLLVWLTCALFSAWTVRPADDMVTALWLNGPFTDFVWTMSRLSALLLPTPLLQGMPNWNETFGFPVAIPLGAFFIFLTFYWHRGLRTNTAILALFLSLLFLFSVAVYPLAIRHLSLIALLSVLLMARSVNEGYRPPRSFGIWLAVIAFSGLSTAAVAVSRPFDTAPEAAQLIREMGLQHEHWLSFPDSRAQGVSALTGIPFERLERNCTQSFIRWNYRSTIQRAPDLQAELDRIAAARGRVYLLSEFDLAMLNHVEPIGKVPAGIDGQAFYLYIVHPELRRREVSLPPCVPGAARPRALAS